MVPDLPVTTNFMVVFGVKMIWSINECDRIDLPKVVLVINEANCLQGGATELQYAFLQLLSDEVVPLLKTTYR